MASSKHVIRPKPRAILPKVELELVKTIVEIWPKSLDSYSVRIHTNPLSSSIFSAVKGR